MVFMSQPADRDRTPRKPRWADLTPLQLASRVLVRAGVAMIILCVLCRFAPQTEESIVVNTLALIASALVAITGLVAIRVDRWRESRADRRD